MDIKKSRQQKIKRLVWVHIEHGDDLLKAISGYCIENKIKAGIVSVIGALQKARFGYYNQKEKKYYENSLNEPVEIVTCWGNISIKDGKPFAHAHISVADNKGNVFGGHLNEGCIVFAAECVIFELKGDSLKREFDETTGLFLWDFSE